MSKARTAGRPAMEFLRAKKLPEAPVYLLHGPDDYLREKLLDRLREEVLDPGFAEFNHVKLHCTSGSKAGLLANALVDLPMMADRRLLELHEAQSLGADAARALVGPLEEAARAGSTVVALCWRPGGRGAQNALLATAQKVGLQVDCSMPEEERPAWLQEALRTRGVDVEPAAVAEILKRTGPDLRHLASQLDKLALYGGRIGVEDVRRLVLRSTEVKTWALTAAIGKRNLREALSILNVLLEEGDGGGLLSYVNTYLKGLAQVHSLSRGGASAAQIAAQIPGKKDFQVRMTLEELRTWSEAELRLAFDMLCRADVRVKTGADPRLVLELLVVQLCSRKGRRAS